MATYAIVDDSGLVVNIVEWDGDTKVWQPPEGAKVVPRAERPAAQIGAKEDEKGDYLPSPDARPRVVLIDPATCPMPDCPMRGETQ